MKRGKQGDGGGRPMIVFDEAQIAQVEALAAVMSKRQLCDYMSVGETTFPRNRRSPARGFRCV